MYDGLGHGLSSGPHWSSFHTLLSSDRHVLSLRRTLALTLKLKNGAVLNELNPTDLH